MHVPASLDARPRRRAARRGRAGADGARSPACAPRSSCCRRTSRRTSTASRTTPVIALCPARGARRASKSPARRSARSIAALCCSCAPSPTTTTPSPSGSSPSCSGLRIFADAAGKMNRSAAVGGGLLMVSQFTLAADTSRGNRPGFSAAAPPALGPAPLRARARAARRRCTRRSRARVRRRHAGALVNDGPVTIPITLRAPNALRSADAAFASGWPAQVVDHLAVVRQRARRR